MRTQIDVVVVRTLLPSRRTTKQQRDSCAPFCRNLTVTGRCVSAFATNLAASCRGKHEIPGVQEHRDGTNRVGTGIVRRSQTQQFDRIQSAIRLARQRVGKVVRRGVTLQSRNLVIVSARRALTLMINRRLAAPKT
jgi:hypothetical protein